VADCVPRIDNLTTVSDNDALQNVIYSLLIVAPVPMLSTAG
jgi:hypothetical protein